MVLFCECVCWFITYTEAPVHSKKGKGINIFTERQVVDSLENKSTSARHHANSTAPSLMVKPSMKTDKNIKYSVIPFTRYQKRPDVGS